MDFLFEQKMKRKKEGRERKKGGEREREHLMVRVLCRKQQHVIKRKPDIV